MLKIAETENDLPKYIDLECPICYRDIDVGEIKDHVPTCMICDNGHMVHNKCFQKTNKHQCPLCKNQHMRYCKTTNGYLYAERKGGKRRRSKKNKYTKGKITKKRRSKNNTKKKGGKKKRPETSTDNYLNNLSTLVNLM